MRCPTDLVLVDLFLFLKLKFKLNGLRFDTTEQILGSSQKVLNTVQESDFKQAFSKLQRVQNLHQLIPMNGSSYPHLHISTTQPFRTGAAESRNFLMAPRIMYRRHCEEDITVLTRAPLWYFYNAPHWGGGLFRAPPSDLRN